MKRGQNESEAGRGVEQRQEACRSVCPFRKTEEDEVSMALLYKKLVERSDEDEE